MKTCKSCQQSEPDVAFHPRRKTCKPCYREINRARQAAKRESERSRVLVEGSQGVSIRLDPSEHHPEIEVRNSSNVAIVIGRSIVAHSAPIQLPVPKCKTIGPPEPVRPTQEQVKKCTQKVNTAERVHSKPLTGRQRALASMQKASAAMAASTGMSVEEMTECANKTANKKVSMFAEMAKRRKIIDG